MEGMDTVKSGEDYDTPEKEFEKYPDITADILNALIYEGKAVVCPTKLQSAETETNYQDEGGKLRRQYEDLAKYATDENGRQILYLIANQTNIDSRMILRKSGYVGGYYRSQYNGQSQDICPIIEIILYWGYKRWKTNLTMRELFRKKSVDEIAWSYIGDEKLHVFEMRHLSDEVVERFTSDMRIVLEYLRDPHHAFSLKQEVRHPEALFNMLAALSEDKRYIDLFKTLQKNDGMIKEGGKAAMCEFMDEIERRWIESETIGREAGRKAGLEEGRVEGKAEGRAEGIHILIDFCKEFHQTFEDTAARLKDKFMLKDDEVQNFMKLYW